MIELQILGRIDLTGLEEDAAGRVLRGAKRLALLTYLALEQPGGFCRRDRLLALLWPDLEASRARHALRNTLYSLRQALGDDVVVSRGQEEVGVNATRLRCDAVAFLGALEEGRDREAMELYRGELLPGFHVDDGSARLERWLEEQRSRLRREALAAAGRLADAAEGDGETGEAVRWAREAAALAPYDEPAHRRLMELLAAAGDRVGAVRAFEAFAGRMARDLGLEPGAETRDLRDRVAPASATGEPTRAAPRPGREPADAGADAGKGRLPEAGREGPSPAEGRSEGSRVRILGLAGAAVVAAVIGLVAWWTAGDGSFSARAGNGDPGASASSELEGRRMAVFPFRVRGDGTARELSYLEEGLPSLLVTALDGAAGLRTVEPRGAVARSAVEDGARPVEAVAADVAGELGADLYVLGDVVAVSNRVRFTATLHATADGRDPRRISVEGTAGELLALVDRLATRMLAAVEPGLNPRLARRAADRSSLAAVEAYLEGERNFRSARFAAASEAYHRAVARDSAFGLAHHRLSVTSEWMGSDELALAAAENAVRHGSGLARRDRRLLEAHLTSLRGEAAVAESLYRSILETYPHDLEAWYQLGEILFHWAPAVGRSITEAREPFRRVLDLSPGHAPAAVHLARIAASEGAPEELESLAERVLQMVPGSDHAWEVRALRAFAGADETERDRVVEGLRDASDRSLRIATWSVAVFAANPAGGARLAELMTAPWRAPGTRRRGSVWLAELALARGRWREAFDRLADLPGGDARLGGVREALFASLPYRHVPDPDARSLEGNLEASADEGLRAFATALLRSRLGDGSGALSLADGLEEGSADDDRVAADHRRLARIVRAHVAWRRGRPGKGLELLGPARVETRSSLMYGADYVQPYERYLRGLLLADAGRAQEAERWFRTFADQHVPNLVYLAPAHLERARLADEAGETARAARHYRAALRLWEDPDPGLRAVRADAVERVHRLAGGGALR